VRNFLSMMRGMANIYSENVSKSVASKVKSITSCIGVAVSGHEKKLLKN